MCARAGKRSKKKKAVENLKENKSMYTSINTREIEEQGMQLQLGRSTDCRNIMKRRRDSCPATATPEAFHLKGTQKGFPFLPKKEVVSESDRDVAAAGALLVVTL